MRLKALPLLLALVLLAAGCGGGGGGDGDEIAGDQFRLSGTQRDAQFAVGSEAFTEQEVLGEMYAQKFEAEGYDDSAPVVRPLCFRTFSGLAKHPSRSCQAVIDARPTSHNRCSFVVEPTPLPSATSANMIGSPVR